LFVRSQFVGKIIEDNEGRERILIGSPIPTAKNRVRTDLERVKGTWAKRFPSSEKYIETYKTYQNEMSGILLLDSNGFDRLALGDPVPDPNTGRRIAPSSGLVINDEEGFERTGYGLLNVQSRHRVVLGMDNGHGKEGLTLFLIDDGPIGLDSQRRLSPSQFGLQRTEIAGYRWRQQAFALSIPVTRDDERNRDFSPNCTVALVKLRHLPHNSADAGGQYEDDHFFFRDLLRSCYLGIVPVNERGGPHHYASKPAGKGAAVANGLRTNA